MHDIGGFEPFNMVLLQDDSGETLADMQLVDRIEKRRSVGREFLLWLWFESELFDGALRTAAHGPFGWIVAVGGERVLDRQARALKGS